VQRVGASLRAALAAYDGKSIAVIGHRATKYGLAYCCGEQSLAAVVATPWEWGTCRLALCAACRSLAHREAAWRHP